MDDGTRMVELIRENDHGGVEIILMSLIDGDFLRTGDHIRLGRSGEEWTVRSVIRCEGDDHEACFMARPVNPH